MRKVMVCAARALGVLAAGLMGVAAPAQAPATVTSAPWPASNVTYPIKSQATPAPEAARPPADVGQIEVYNGSRRTVHYVAPNLSAGERASLHDLARAENETAYADELLALKRQYVNSERLLEPYRRSIQQRLYGYSTDSSFTANVNSGWGGWGGGFYNYAWPYGGYYGNGGWGGSYSGGESTGVSHSLANGMGDEGVMKNSIAREIGTQATPEFAASTARDRAAALGRVASSDRLAKAFGLDKSNIVPAAATTPSHIILTLKGGEKLEGSLYGEDADWFRVDTPTGTVSVRKSEVTRVEVPKK